MSSIEPAAQVDFVYDASFYFEDLPSRSNDQGSGEPHPRPAWYLTARAPVPFSEDVFWNVLERWILEAPSIIPPIAKVEILHDYTQQGDDDHGSVASSHTSSDLAQLLVESSTDNSKNNSNSSPFRTIRRRLLPKRANKDPVMEEQLFFVRSSQGSSSNGSSSSSSSSYAVFAPIVRSSTTPSPSSSHSDRTESIKWNQGQEHDQNRDFMTQAKSLLPFYYPKVRGFRYGYVADPEEAPEDRDDHDHDHDGEGVGDGCFEYKDEEEKEVEAEKQDGTKAASKVKPMSKRLGWITLELFLAGDEGEFTEKMQYAFKELFKKLYKWGVNTTKGFTKSRVQHDIMVPKELYLATYARLKETHAQRWVQSWPEKTDPTKFVFEDIAIASWLVALWELERAGQRSDLDNDGNRNTIEQGQVQEDGCKKRKRESQKQTFVDLGCGNGLLTHILNEEGHKGTGIDIVARKVWDIYGPGTSLEAKTVIPNETVFNNVDWIIGNHADELAPWIPIIAARSKPLTRFAVIPCCFFDLNGSRHQFPKGAPEGKYKAYQ
ncbi:tRNA methyltransferase 44, partial [Dissophora globulifera]